ncbi:hypothetical protein FRC10_010952, partial [Ceratobasidium sp. 414]
MRFNTFLSFFLLALISVLSFVAANVEPVQDLEVRDSLDIAPVYDEGTRYTIQPGGLQNKTDEENKLVCPWGTGLCPNDPGSVVAPRGGGAAKEGAAASLGITASATFGVKFGAVPTERFVCSRKLNR